MIAARTEIQETEGVFDRAVARPTPSKRLMHPAQIPPTAVGGLFILSLHRQADRLLPESHPWQWVDCSGAAYKTNGPPILFPSLLKRRGRIITEGDTLLAS
jgi:hypothetical protein